ncbi:MAG: hypothetical protein ACI828_000794 [Flavobacteriales bacterium]|jgi:hypothetical protein
MYQINQKTAMDIPPTVYKLLHLLQHPIAVSYSELKQMASSFLFRDVLMPVYILPATLL